MRGPTEPVVGLGSVCRRSGIATIVEIIMTLRAMGIRLHGFGLHSRALTRCGHLLSSVDTMAWSRTARWASTAMPGCEHTGKCINCPRYAQRWYAATIRHARSSSTPHRAATVRGNRSPHWVARADSGRLLVA